MLVTYVTNMYRILNMQTATLLSYGSTYPHFGKLKDAQNFISNCYIACPYKYIPIKVQIPKGTQTCYILKNITHNAAYNYKVFMTSDLAQAYLNRLKNSAYYTITQVSIPNRYELRPDAMGQTVNHKDIIYA